MNAAVVESEKAVEQYYEDIGVIRECCEKVMQPWTEITTALHHSGEAVSRFYFDRARSPWSIRLSCSQYYESGGNYHE